MTFHHLEEEDSGQSLAMSWCGIREVSELDQTLKWNLSHNLISSLSTLPSNPNLKELNISYNCIEEISEDCFSNFLQIRKLDLSSNLITKIQNLDNLSHLQNLNMSSNRISLIENLEKASKLYSLNAANNRINAFYLSSPLPNLQILKLDRNPILILDFLSYFCNLSILEINWCFISTISEISQLKQIERLSASHNKICDCSLESNTLIDLNLSHNFITTLEGLNSNSLTTLDISFNPITDEGFSVEISTLQHLNCSNTSITQIPTCFQSLQTIDCSNSMISEIGVLPPSLECINLLNTPLTRNLYPASTNGFNSIKEYDAAFPDTAGPRALYRSQIISQTNVKVLDGIDTSYERRSGAIRSDAYQMNCNLRSLLGMEERKLNEITNAELIEENNKLLQLVQLINENKKLRKYFSLGADPYVIVNIDDAIEYFEAEREKLLGDKKYRPRHIVARRCEQKMISWARTSTMINDSEWETVETWIAAKMIPRIKLVELKRTKFVCNLVWTTLVVDVGGDSRELLNGIKKPIIVADHMNVASKKFPSTFMICALQAGQQMVKLNDGMPSHAEIKKASSKYDTLLFNSNGQQFLFAMNMEKIVPIYLVTIEHV